MAWDDWDHYDVFEDHDGFEQPDACRYCDFDIWWIDGKPYDDGDGELPHLCPARIAKASEFPDLT